MLEKTDRLEGLWWFKAPASWDSGLLAASRDLGTGIRDNSTLFDIGLVLWYWRVIIGVRSSTEAEMCARNSTVVQPKADHAERRQLCKERNAKLGLHEGVPSLLDRSNA